MNSTLNTLVGLIDAMQLKDRIKEAMVGAKLTKAALARATNSTPGAVTQWLSGETKSLKAEKAELMEVATGYLSRWLVSGIGYKRKQDLPSNQPAGPVDIAQAATKTIAPDLVMIVQLLEAMPQDQRQNAVMAVMQVLVTYMPRASAPATPEQAPAVTRASTPV